MDEVASEWVEVFAVGPGGLLDTSAAVAAGLGVPGSLVDPACVVKAKHPMRSQDDSGGRVGAGGPYSGVAPRALPISSFNLSVNAAEASAAGQARTWGLAPTLGQAQGGAGRAHASVSLPFRCGFYLAGTQSPEDVAAGQVCPLLHLCSDRAALQLPVYVLVWHCAVPLASYR